MRTMSAGAFLSVLAGACLFGADMCPVNTDGPIRVGIIGFEDNAIDRLKTYRSAFDEVSRELLSGRPARTARHTFAVYPGTYLEVLDWYRTCKIDVGIVTAGVAAIILAETRTSNPIILEEIRNGKKMYRSQLIIPAGEQEPTAQQVIIGIRNGSLKVIAVNPVSASGFIIPAMFLSHVDSTFLLPMSAVLWTQNHDESARRIATSMNSKPRYIGFISSDQAGKLPSGVHPVPCLASEKGNFGLCDYASPRGAVLVNDRLPLAEQTAIAAVLKASLARAISAVSPASQFTVIRASDDYAREVKPWREFLQKEIMAEPDYLREISDPRLTLDDVLKDLHTYHSFYGGTPRLALVLSGGGAKCAYQGGALVGLVDAISKHRRTAMAGKPKDDTCSKLDANVVVGTSGGGLNALLFADRVNVAGNPAEIEAFLHRSWADSSLAAVARPLPRIALSGGLVFGMVGLSLALFVGLLYCRALHICSGKWREARRAQGLVLLVLAVTVTAWVLVMRYSESNKYSPVVQIAYAFFMTSRFRLGTALVCTLFLLVFFRRTLWLPQQALERVKNFDFLRMLAAGFLLTVTVVTFGWLLLSGSNLFDSRAVELRVRDAYVKARGLTPSTTAANRLLGEDFNRNRLNRDLIITTSVVSASTLQDDEAIGHELYFYASRESLSDPRFRNLEGLQVVNALQVAAASSTVWPLFDTALIKFPVGAGWLSHGPSLELADGGFSHNNPIEAAVLWGATHVIVINATPNKHAAGTSFGDALDFLFGQAQRIDQLARGRSHVYELRPVCEDCSEDKDYLAEQREHKLRLFPDTLQFVGEYLDSAFRRGKMDAERNRFRRIRSEPVF